MNMLLNILLVEDNPGDVDLIREMLTKTGMVTFSVESVARLSTALIRLEDGDIDLVLLDLGLPDSKGIDTLITLRKNKPEAPIIVLTGLADEETGIRAVKEGAQDYLIKGQVNTNLLTRSIQYAIERKAADRKIHESDERFRIVLNNAPITIFAIDKNGVFRLSEGKGLEQVGLKPGENVGVSALDLFAKLPVTQHNGEIVTGSEVIRRVMAGETMTGITKLKSTYFDNQFTPYHDAQGQVIGMIGVATIITERVLAEAELKKSERFVQNILSSVDEAFVVVDREYGILTANRAYCEQAGKPLEDIVGKPCYEISHHAARPCHELDQECACKRTFETGESAVSVHTHTDEKGKQRFVEVKTFAMKDKIGELTSIIEVINDITEKRALEGQLRHAQKMEGIGTLAGGIAHDFNNILSAIIGYGHITLMKMQKDDPLRMNIEHMLESADRAASLTQSLLTFSRKQITDRKAVDLNNIIKKVEKFLVRIIGEDVAVHMTLGDKELSIFADAGQLEQVFMNLATNARDAMPHGGSFLIETSRVALDRGFVSAHGYGKPGTYAMTSVTDTGTGMNEETRKKIFEPFFTTKEVGKGTGLGLAMVYGILKQNDGFINVYSEPDKGTTFRIYFPLNKAATAEERKEIEVPYPKGGSETILLAEDDANLRSLSVVVLEQMGYTVIMASNGEEAVEKFKANKDRIQLLLFDIMMPKKSGREAYEEIRKVTPAVPALFVSGYSLDMLREKDLIEEGSVMISKPMSPQALLIKVREVLDRKNERT